jgi:hypothetical protein
MSSARAKWRACQSWVSPKLPWVAAVTALAVVITLIVVQLLATDGASDSTTLGLTGFVIVLLFAVLAPLQTKRVFGRIKTFKAAGVELGLEEIKRAERVRPLPREDDRVEIEKRPSTGLPAADYRKVVVELEARLRFVWAILVLGQVSDVTESDYSAIVELLGTRGLLSEDEGTFALELLDRNHLQLTDWDSSTQETFLDSAWEFAIRFGPLIWDRYVRQQLEIPRDGQKWLVADYQQQKGHRRDFLAYRDQQQRWAVMAARVAGTPDSPTSLAASRERLAKFTPESLVSGRRIIIPDIREATESDDEVRILKLSDLIADPRSAFDARPDPV